MRLVIRIFILLIILILVFLSMWGEWALERIGTYVLETPVDINHVKFIPHRLLFRLYGIDLPEKHILIPLGTLSILPPRLEFRGIDLSKLDFGFKKGELGGYVEGMYVWGNCKLYGELSLNNIIYSDTHSEILGISSDEFQKIIDLNKGNIGLDFTYNGPLNEITELYRYRPGKKTLTLIKKYLIEEVKKSLL